MTAATLTTLALTLTSAHAAIRQHYAPARVTFTRCEQVIQQGQPGIYCRDAVAGNPGSDTVELRHGRLTVLSDTRGITYRAAQTAIRRGWPGFTIQFDGCYRRGAAVLCRLLAATFVDLHGATYVQVIRTVDRVWRWRGRLLESTLRAAYGLVRVVGGPR